MIDLRPDLLAIVQEILQRLVPACEVRAFGSRQKWTAKETSDLDLVVVGPQRLPLKTMATLKEAFEESILPMRVDVLDWNAISEEFRRVIEAGFEVIQGGEASPLAPAPAHRPLSVAEGDVSKGGGRGSSATPLSGGAPRNAPEGAWLRTTIGEVIAYGKGEIKTGPFGTKLKASEYTTTGVPVISVGEVGFGRFTLRSETPKVDETVTSRMPEYVLHSGDIVFGRKGSVERSSIVRADQDGWFLGSDGIRLRLPSDVDPYFFAYQFQTEAHKSWMLQHAAGSTMPSLNQGTIERIPVVVPPRPIQKAITHILGTLDDRIELCRRMNETLEAMARALFKDWFIDYGPVRAKMEGREPPGLSPEVAALFPSKLVDSELGEIPEGWEISTIGDEVRAVGGGTPSTKESEFWENGCHFWATPKDLSKLQFPVILETERKITDAGLAKISSGLLPVGTLLLSSRAPIGYMAITEVPLAINQGFIAMICDKRISNIFAYFWCKENMDRIVGNANGSTFQEISKSNFRPLPMLVPSKKVMAEYSVSVSNIHQRLVTNQIQVAALSTLRDTLLPKLLSGVLSIPEAMLKVEAVG